MAPFFSIIIPACEVAPWIAKTAESILQQSCGDYEALFVCEKSSDSTLELIQSFCKDNQKLELIERERSGSASVARNLGMQWAKGRYLLFLDGDDWLETDALEKMHNLLVKFEFPDLVSGEYRICRGETISDGSRVAPHLGKVLSGVEALTLLLRKDAYRSATWRNLYNRDFLLSTGLQQTPGRRHQDDEWTPRVFCAAKRVVLSEIVFYNYRRRPGSVTMDGNRKSFLDMTDNTVTLLDFLTSSDLPCELKERIAAWQLRTMIHFFSARRNVPADMRISNLKKIFVSRSRRQVLWCAKRFSTRGEMLFFRAMKIAYDTGLFFPLPFLYSLLFGRET